MKRGSLLPAVAVLATLAVPTTASAATSIELGSDQLTVIGDAFANDITVRRVNDGYVITDPLAKLAPETVPACRFTTPGDTHEVKCTRSGEVAVLVEGRAGADELTAAGGTLGAALDGGDGDDRLQGGPGPDSLRGRAGGDDLRGGAGIDTATYSERAAGVTITLPVDEFDVDADDGNAADGVGTLSRDAIFTDVERAVGGDGDDAILGNNGANTLSGRGGRDVLTGRGGDDVVNGGVGGDVMNGNDGFDLISYADRTDPVRVTFDGVDNDGDPVTDASGFGIGNPQVVFDRIGAGIEGAVGGGGDDILVGDLAGNRLDGGDGDDSLGGGAGNDDVNGGEGNDTLLTDPGADDLSGGRGGDFVSYELRTEPVSVSLDGVADDGTTGSEHDNVRPDVESVTGSSGDDVLIGGPNGDFLDGRLGDDRLEGRAGPDVLKGGAVSSDVIIGGDGVDLASFEGQDAVTVTLDGLANDGSLDALVQPAGGPEHDNVQTEGVIGTKFDDVITGNDGPNFLRGGGGDDTLRGGGDHDELEGGLGVDALFGEAGPDLVQANDGVRDQIDCGPDTDLLSADLADGGGAGRGGAFVVAGAGCESQGLAPAGRLPNVAAAKRVRIADGRARVALRCPRASHVRCAGTLRLERLDGTVLARGRFALRKGKPATLDLQLRRRAGRGNAQVVTRERDSDGRPKLTQTRVRLARRL